MQYLCEKTEQVKKCKANPQIKTQAILAVQKVQSELLDETDICFSQSTCSGQNLRKFYCLDEKTRESALLTKTSQTDIALYQGLLQHSATSTMLQEATSFSDHHIGSWFSKNLSFLHWAVYLLIAVFYPVLELLSILPPRKLFHPLRVVLSTYPISFFVNWGSYLWNAVLIYLFQKYQGSDENTEIVETVLLCVLWLFCFGKIKEEKEQWKSTGSANSFGRKLSIYLFDKWNYMVFFLKCRILG